MPRPASSSVPATERLRGLKRLLPLPCANTTSPTAAGGTQKLGLELDALLGLDADGATDGPGGHGSHAQRDVIAAVPDTRQTTSHFVGDEQARRIRRRRRRRGRTQRVG